MNFKPSLRLPLLPLYGAVIDLLVFFASFVYFGGPHGPAGPAFVLNVLNAPIAAVGIKVFPYSNSEMMEFVLMIGEVAVNGALYGVIAALLIALWRAIFRRRPSS